MPALAPVRLRVRSAGRAPELMEFSAASAAEAVRRATQLGLVVLAVEPDERPAGRAAGRTSVRMSVRPGDFSLSLFSQELLALLEAGLHLNEALSTLLAKERNEGSTALLGAMASELAKGRNFSDALADHPHRFPAIYVAIVRAAERTGDLASALSRYIAYQLQFDQMRKKVVSACIYPAMLLLVGGAVTLFLLTYVVPRFSLVYASAGRDMPALSAALLAVGGFIRGHGLGVALIACALLFAAGLWLRRCGWAGVVDALARLPGIAAQAEQFRLARFYRAVGLLLAAGIALPRALGMVSGLLGARQQRGLAQVRRLVEQGQPFSQALVAQGLASAVARSLLTVGERTGQLGDMLERSARFHDQELERWLDWASRLLEPVMMTVIGVVIGGIVLLMYLPIFELAGGL